MSVHHLSHVLRHPDDLPYTGSALIVLLILADRAGDDDRCWPSIERIQAEARLSRASVFNALAVLEVDGVIVRERDGRRGTYRLTGPGFRPVQDLDPSRSWTQHVQNLDPDLEGTNEPSAYSGSPEKSENAARTYGKEQSARKSQNALEREAAKNQSRKKSPPRVASTAPRPPKPSISEVAARIERETRDF